MELEEGYYASPRWTYEILDCAMPMTFDTYSNCAHQCLYCFSFFQRAIGSTADDYLHHKVRAVSVERIKKMFTNPDEFGSQFKQYIKRRMTLQWGGLSDGFDWYEKKFGTSLEILNIFNDLDYPISISTKGVWWTEDERYRAAVRGRKNQHWKYSIITADEEHVKALEPGVAPSKERFAAMARLNDLGVGATTLRFRPFVLGTSDKCIEQMMKMARDSGCYSVTTEFLTWESRASNTSRSRLDAMSKVLGYDMWEFYMKNSARASGLLRLNYDLKRPYILQMKQAAEAYGLKFFVSDAHHKEDSYNAGCCGLPESGPLSNINRGQYAHAILVAKRDGLVHWSDISEQAYEILSQVPVIQAEGFPSDTAERAKRHYQSMFDYMHDIWNNPKSWQSPARYFGGALVPSAPDENGDIIYLYNKPFIEEGLRVQSVNELAIRLHMVGKPNADRYDEMMKDGGDYGHVAYPVVVFSSGRSDVATTPQLLDDARIQNWVLVVPADEAAKYAEKFPMSDILLLPRTVQPSIGAARDYILERYKEEGYPYVWMLDDDLKSFSRTDGEKLVKCSPRAVLSGLEQFVNDYTNIAILGVNTNGSFSNSFASNEWSTMKGLYLVNIQTGLTFGHYSLCEVEEFALHHLEEGGWATVLHEGYTVEIGDPGYGGCTGTYLAGHRRIIMQELESKYPDSFILVEDRKPLYYKFQEIPELFQNTLRPRALVEMEKEISNGGAGEQ